MPGGGLPALAWLTPLYSAASARIGIADNREPTPSSQLASRLSSGSSLLSLPAAVHAGGQRQLESLAVRPDVEFQPLRGQGGSAASRRGSCLLLFHPHALCLAHAL